MLTSLITKESSRIFVVGIPAILEMIRDNISLSKQNIF